MRFREIREIKPDYETRRRQEEKEEGFRQIKPDSNITDKEARAYWNNLFKSMEESN